MKTSPAVDRVRERIVQTASELFYSRGINATGVDMISEVAGVSKRSLYQRFASKDELVAEYLAGTAVSLLEDYLPQDDEGSPVARILAVFAAAKCSSANEDFRGCPLINAAAELASPSHPGRAFVVDGKRQLQKYFARQGALAGARDPQALAEQLAMLFDGGLAFALVRGGGIPASILTAAQTLIDAQIPPASHTEVSAHTSDVHPCHSGAAGEPS